MNQSYVILRDMRRARTSGPFVGVNASILEAALPEPKLELASLSPTELHDVSRDPEVTQIAPRMHTKLIAPTASANAAIPTWGIDAIAAHTSPYTGAGVIAAVLDTGIDAQHSAFVGVNLVESDFSGAGNGDVVGHGTHCAGTIFGRNVTGQRIGVARGVTTALIGKVLDNNGGGDSLMLFNGIQWAVRNQAQVISMSLGYDFPGYVVYLTEQKGLPLAAATSMALQAYRANLRMFDSLMEMNTAMQPFARGAVVVAASGNESNRPQYDVHTSLPAAANGVISVGALGPSNTGLQTAPFSNVSCELVAPGVAISSAKKGGGLVSLQGTSMACPHVAGAAVLWCEQALTQGTPVNAANISARVLANATTAGFATYRTGEHGVGLVQAPQ